MCPSFFLLLLLFSTVPFETVFADAKIDSGAKGEREIGPTVAAIFYYFRLISSFQKSISVCVREWNVNYIHAGQ
jgi:hypothetical protein